MDQSELPLIKKRVEALVVFKSMQVGQVITQMHIDAIRIFFGPVLDKLKPIDASILEAAVKPTDEKG